MRDSAVESFAAMRRNAESVEMTTKQGDCSLPAKNETEISVHLQAVPLSSYFKCLRLFVYLPIRISLVLPLRTSKHNDES